MNTRWQILRPFVALMAGLMVMASTAHAQEDGSVMDQIGLTAAQKEQVQKLRDNFAAKTEKLRAQRKRLLDDEHRLKNMAKPNEGELRRKLQERAEVEVELTLALNRFNEDILALLTPDQKKKLERLKTERRR